MNDTQSIRQRLEEIQAELDKLHEEEFQLSSQISEAERQIHREDFDRWNIGAESCLVLFPKHPSAYHWTIVKTIVVKEVDIEHQFIDTITMDYRQSDYEYYCKSEGNRIYFDQLAPMEAEYNIYLIDVCQLVIIQHRMCNLEVTYENYQEHDNIMREVADRIIS